MAETLYDPACYDLAEHFLQDAPCRKGDPAAYKAHCHKLAQHLQRTVEDWLSYDDDAAASTRATPFVFTPPTAEEQTYLDNLGGDPPNPKTLVR